MNLAFLVTWTELSKLVKISSIFNDVNIFKEKVVKFNNLDIKLKENMLNLEKVW